ncbi:hypothetical protein IRJ41_002289 [Triplophysa rosa]|uniref:Uncharacterized protein n=1 Tax=Triplophysa rosa TaxID=992332 RepID=A0A9W7WIM0_TRIRA|nr:hypothetical protein IRJ41_002289 [Triplophysa rosa]
MAFKEGRLDRERRFSGKRDQEASEGMRGRGQCGAGLLSFLCCRCFHPVRCCPSKASLPDRLVPPPSARAALLPSLRPSLGEPVEIKCSLYKPSTSCSCVSRASFSLTFSLFVKDSVYNAKHVIHNFKKYSGSCERGAIATSSSSVVPGT